jgi:purine-binding chemotaxis protein CheW
MNHTSSESANEREQQLTTFTVGGLFFGIDVRQVQEVLRYQEMTLVPQSGSVIAGLINLRGEIVTAIDMRRRLGLKDREDGVLPLNVVVRSDDGAISLLVDEIGDVIGVGRDSFEQPPDSIDKQQRELLDGVYKLDGRLLLALSTAKVLDLSPTAS